MPHVFERPRVVGNMHFFVSCQAGVENKQLFPPLSSNSPLSKIKIHSLIPLKKDSRLLLYICLQDISPANDLKTFYIDIKTIERVKQQTVFQER